MSGVSIPNLPPAISVSGNEEIEIVQNGTSRRATVSQVFTSAVTSVSFGTTGFTPSSPTIGNVVVSGTLNVANGGTGGTNATDARTNLSAAKSGVNTDITQLGGLGNGSLSAPSLTFSSETNTGLYKSGAGDLSVSILGAQIGTFSSTGLAITGSLSMSRLNLTDSVTGTASTSTINAATTWNTTGTPTAWKLNVTDTASNASSLLMDLQVGGASRFNVSKAGIVSTSNRFAAGGNSFITSDRAFFQSGVVYVGLHSGAYLGWSAAGDASASLDTTLYRDAADTLAQRRGTNAQSFRVYNTFTDASNYERGVFDWVNTPNSLTIGTQQAGTGTARSLRLITQGDANLLFITNSATRLDISSLGLRATANLTWTTDNTYDIGASGASRPRRLYLGGGSLTGSAADSSVEINPTWNTTGTPTAVKLNVTDTASNANSLLMDLQVGGANRFRVNKGGVAYVSALNGAGGDFNVISIGTTNNGGASTVQLGGVLGEGVTVRAGTGFFAFSSSTGDAIHSLRDTILSRKAAANLQLGAADAAAPVAQSLSVQSVVAGTTNVAGANFTINGSQGTGTGAGGAIILQTAAAGTSGSAQNALTERMRLTSAGYVGIGTSAPGFELDVKGAGTTTSARIVGGGITTAPASGGTLTIHTLTNAVARTGLDISFTDGAASRLGGFKFSDTQTSGDWTACQMEMVQSYGAANEIVSKLQVEDTTWAGMRFVSQTNAGAALATSPTFIWRNYTTEQMRITAAGDVLVTGGGGLGYGTGSGGTVTQATSRTTGVTLNKTTGSITLVSAAGTTAWQSFTVTNSTVAANDVVILSQRSGTDLYMLEVTAVAAGSFRISFATTGGTTTEQPVFNFAVIKGATS